MRVIANNLANVEHHRLQARPRQFRHARLSGRACGGAAERRPKAAYAVGLNLGTGVLGPVDQPDRYPRHAPDSTGNSLDLALDGDGYFQVQPARRPARLYPRGQFHPLRRGPTRHQRRAMPVQPAISPSPKALIFAVDHCDRRQLFRPRSTVRIGTQPARPDHRRQLRQSRRGSRQLSDNFLLETGASGPAQVGNRRRRRARPDPPGHARRLERQHRPRTGRHDRDASAPTRSIRR